MSMTWRVGCTPFELNIHTYARYKEVEREVGAMFDCMQVVAHRGLCVPLFTVRRHLP